MTEEAEALAEQLGKTSAELKVQLINLAALGREANTSSTAWRMYAAGVAMMIANDLRAWAHRQIAEETQGHD
jgi:hypothetical protein